MFDKEKNIAEATEEFKRVVDYVRKEGRSHDAYTVERSVLAKLLAIGRHLMAAYFEEMAGGDVGPAIEMDSGEPLPRERLKDRSELAKVLGQLKAARERSGLSLSDLTELTGMDRSALSKLEKGKRANPTFETLARYAEAFGKHLQLKLADTGGK